MPPALPFPLPDAGAPLAVQTRSDRVESLHSGHLVVVNPEGEVLASRGNPQERFYARSTMKPIQILPLLMTGAADHYQLPEACLAVGMASHSGEPGHLEVVADMLARAGVSVDMLQCGSHVPYHGPTANALLKGGMTPGVLHCNCSGKHAAMLAACRHQGWDVSTYRQADHPLQQMVRGLLAELGQVSETEIGYGIDGCGLPVWHLPLFNLAVAFTRLSTPDQLRGPLQEAAQRATTVMTAHPYMVAGEGRFDTDLMTACGGRLIGKGGGEAVHVGGWLGKGVGWALKVTDGNRRAVGPALARALDQVGHPLPQHAALAPHVTPEVFNNRGERVGHVLAAW